MKQQLVNREKVEMESEKSIGETKATTLEPK